MNHYKIEYSGGRPDATWHGLAFVRANDCREALRKFESHLDEIGAAVDAINPADESPDRVPEEAIQAAREVLTDLSRLPVAAAYPDGPCLEREDMEAVKSTLAQLTPKESTATK